MTQSEFKWKHFAPEIILWSLRWYGTTALSYAYVSDMLAECGIFVNALPFTDGLLSIPPNYIRSYVDINSRLLTLHGNLMKHTVRVKGKWLYLYRVINKQGKTLDFYLSYKRNKESAYQFLKHCLRPYRLDNQPKTLNTNKHSSYGNAITRLKEEGLLRVDVNQRKIKSLNNGIESDLSLLRN